MDKFTIIVNGAENRRGKNQAVAGKIADYLKNHQKECVILPAGEKKEGQSYSYTDPERIPKGTECIIVLGGDGTLLQAARDVVDLEIPLFGINMGTLGYLAEIDQYSIYPAMDRLMSDRFTIEKRMMLFGTLIHEGQAVGSDIALNDIVLNRMGIDAFRFELAVNGQLFNEYSADGMVVATPTGSTAYNLSAGGPIVAPEAELLVLTPLCPHSLNSRSIVLPPDNHLSLQIQTTGRTKVSLSFDGDTVVDIEPGDTIEIAKSEIETTLIQLKQVPFLENIRNKMKQI